MLVWMTLGAGITVIVCGCVAVTQLDRRWRSRHLQCCRCLSTWYGREKVCGRCGARGRNYDWRAVRFAGFPTHDWQGYLDTGPIPIPIIDIPQQRSPLDYPTTTEAADREPSAQPGG